MFAKQHVLLQAKFSTLTDMTNHPRIINVRRPAGSLYRPSLVTFVLYHPSYGLFVCLTLYIFYKTSDLTNQKSNTKTMTNTRLEKTTKRATQRHFIRANAMDLNVSFFSTEPHFHVYVPPRLYSCCVLFPRPDGWSFNSSSLSSLEMGKSHNTIFKVESVARAGFNSGRISKGFVLGNFPISTLNKLCLTALLS